MAWGLVRSGPVSRSQGIGAGAETQEKPTPCALVVRKKCEPVQRLEQPRTHSGLVPGSNPGGPTSPLNMAWVYMLRGETGRYYIGSTIDLERRLKQHREGHTYTTRRLGRSLELAASLEVGQLVEARHWSGR